MTSWTMTSRTGAAAHGRQAPVNARLAGLGRALDGLRRRPSVDVKRALLVAGATGMGLGLVIIVLGWYGASHSAYLFQEIPYLISGGLLGVALVAGGGFLFFAAWLVRMMEDNGRLRGACRADAGARRPRPRRHHRRRGTRRGGRHQRPRPR